jgi:hypothetical protein
MDPSTTHSSSGRNVRQKRAHSSSTNIRTDESAAKLLRETSQGSNGSVAGGTVAATAASRVNAAHKTGHLAKGSKRDATSPSHIAPPVVDSFAKEQTAVSVRLRPELQLLTLVM